ncbi:MAG TPA: carbamoyl-phosphate synthase large subunit [Solirubrobacterales bacterium]|jgi:carbamoyl-phosphate synthase large subunit|nr:carbamoyl-phosphate synthase large subunit [Solirubrobacterales bacterium]
MPRRDDIHKILVIGSGPIVIGQAAEFDYSGVQACKVLLEEGFEVVLVNSNPATIMTDPEFATATYIEPLLPGPVTRIIEKERPDALLPTLGGQTALNLAMSLHEDGTLERCGVELIGADAAAIRRAEDREEFRRTMTAAGLRIPWSITVESVAEVEEGLADGRIKLPAIVRPAFTMGGQGGGVGHSETELLQVVSEGLAASPINQVLVEESVLGWGEFELEVMRDRNDNVVIVCSIENVDPMGVHTGDSVTVAPAQTLTDPLYQDLRDQAIRVIRAIGVETGGSNVQFAVNPEDGEIVVIEMNPRVSRSSALASKATGFPIAKMAAKLAVGYALEEIPNDITRATPASFEPTIDYVVTKIPRFAFEKFPGSEGRLSTYMQSVGEAMAIGRTFRESFAKALRSRELDAPAQPPADDEELLAALERPCAERFDHVLEAFRRGLSVEAVHERCRVDRWFLRELELLAREGDGTEGMARAYKAVDTCAAEFEAATPYYYSGHERPGPDGAPPASEIRRGERDSVVILGAGPNRIGQGIEFDYCCVHAAMTARELGRDAVMVNCNPETVSTDYDTSDRLYFEPLTAEDVLAVCERERPEGVIVQFGGQTPLKLARTLEEAGVPLLGTPVDAIDLAEDRSRFGDLLRRLGVKHPPYGTAVRAEEAATIAERVGFPLLVRPSYVLGGRAMAICYSNEDLAAYLEANVKADQEHPLLLDRFLENAIEVDVDALGDGESVYVAGIMQHVEEAGVHSGDSACVIPPLSLGEEMLEEIRRTSERIALELGVVGLINIQYGVAAGELYVIEANPRASRTVPFVSKAIGVPLAKLACRLMLGEKLADLELPEGEPGHVSVKEAVLPFARFAGADSVLGPEMKSTGEVMGIAADFPTAFGKAQAAAGVVLPESGSVFITVTDTDKPAATQLAARFHDLGFEVIATGGTAQAIERMGVPVTRINKLHEGSPHVLDLIRKRRCDLVINTPTGSGARADGYEIRTAAVRHGIPCVTTMTGATAAARAIAAGRQGDAEVRSLQEIHGAAGAGEEADPAAASSEPR